jgi:uncharacterized alkaline shock family protein YloU
MNGGRMVDAQRLEDAERLRSQVLGTHDLFMDEEAEGGAIKISENVIAAVVRKYTLEVDGVVRFASGSIVGGIAGMIAKRSYESSMVIDLDEDAVNISITLVFRFGVRIPDVAQAVQEVVRLRVEEFTGKHVSRVNVLVHDLEDASPSRKGDDVGAR